MKTCERCNKKVVEKDAKVFYLEPDEPGSQTIDLCYNCFIILCARVDKVEERMGDCMTLDFKRKVVRIFMKEMKR